MGDGYDALKKEPREQKGEDEEILARARQAAEAREQAAQRDAPDGRRRGRGFIVDGQSRAQERAQAHGHTLPEAGGARAPGRAAGGGGGRGEETGGTDGGGNEGFRVGARRVTLVVSEGVSSCAVRAASEFRSTMD